MRVTKYIKRASRLLVYTNLLVALAAAAQMALTYLLLDLPIQVPLIMVEFFSTLLFYNFTLYLSLPKKATQTPFARTNWIFQNRISFISISILTIVLLVYYALQLRFYTQVFLGIIGLVSALYAYPIFKYRGEKVNLRSVPYTKVFFITIIWLMSTFWLPIFDSQIAGEISATHNLPIRSIHRFLFLLICTLPFDLRDAKADTLYGMKTFSTQLGIKNSILLINTLLILHGFLSLYLDVSTNIIIALLLTDVLLFSIFNLWIKKRKDYLLYYLMDFFLVLQLLVVMVFRG